jgi:hypothetical protein
MVVRTTYAGERSLNVLKFSSPIFGTMMSAQTKKMAVYFPIKAQQPEIEFEVIFKSVAEYNDFQQFVRTTQLNGLTNDTDPGVTLWWPQRGILNWTGTIKNFVGGGERFVYAPKAQFTVDLVDSLVSRRTTVNSIAPIFDTIYGLGMPDGLLAAPQGIGGLSGNITLT